MQVLMQKSKRALAVDCMRADEPFDFRLIGDVQFCRIQIADFRIFVRDPVVLTNPVKVPAFDHKRAWTDQSRHLRIVKRTAKIPFEDFVFAGPDIAEVVPSTGIVSTDSLKSAEQIEGACSRGRGYASLRFSAVAQAIERDSIRINEWL